MTVLTLHAKQDHLGKIASTRDPIKALAEFVWNALDADATRVAVDFVRNRLGGLDGVIVRDNGSGITHPRAELDFSNLGESWKRTTNRTPGQRALHGKEGRGRLRFFSLAQKARWKTIYKEGDGRRGLTIQIDSGTLEKCDVSEPEPV